MAENNSGADKQKQENIVYVDSDLKELIPMFLENRADNIAELKKLLKEENYEGIEKLGHKIKGSGGGYGFDKVTDLGREIEQAAAAGNTKKLRDLIEELAEHMDKVEIKYE